MKIQFNSPDSKTNVGITDVLTQANLIRMNKLDPFGMRKIFFNTYEEFKILKLIH